MVAAEMNEFNGITVILLRGSLVPGSRGWSRDMQQEYLGQVAVLESLLRRAARNGLAPIVAMHWPPMFKNERSRFSDLLEEFQVPLPVRPPARPGWRVGASVESEGCALLLGFADAGGTALIIASRSFTLAGGTALRTRPGPCPTG